MSSDAIRPGRSESRDLFHAAVVQVAVLVTVLTLASFLRVVLGSSRFENYRKHVFVFIGPQLLGDSRY